MYEVCNSECSSKNTHLQSGWSFESVETWSAPFDELGLLKWNLLQHCFSWIISYSEGFWSKVLIYCASIISHHNNNISVTFLKSEKRAATKNIIIYPRGWTGKTAWSSWRMVVSWIRSGFDLFGAAENSNSDSVAVSYESTWLRSTVCDEIPEENALLCLRDRYTWVDGYKTVVNQPSWRVGCL